MLRIKKQIISKTSYTHIRISIPILEKINKWTLLMTQSVFFTTYKFIIFFFRCILHSLFVITSVLFRFYFCAFYTHVNVFGYAYLATIISHETYIKLDCKTNLPKKLWFFLLIIGPTFNLLYSTKYLMLKYFSCF